MMYSRSVPKLDGTTPTTSQHLTSARARTWFSTGLIGPCGSDSSSCQGQQGRARSGQLSHPAGPLLSFSGPEMNTSPRRQESVGQKLFRGSMNQRHPPPPRPVMKINLKKFEKNLVMRPLKPSDWDGVVTLQRRCFPGGTPEQE